MAIRYLTKEIWGISKYNSKLDIGLEPFNHPDSYISACKEQTSYSQQPLRRAKRWKHTEEGRRWQTILVLESRLFIISIPVRLTPLLTEYWKQNTSFQLLD